MSEVRPIDANALSEWIDESVRQYGNQYSTDMLNMFGLFKEVIDNAPTVEPEELKEVRNICEHWNDKSSSFVSACNAFEDILHIFELSVEDMRGSKDG